MNLALKLEWIDRNPFANTKLKFIRHEKEFLTKTELQLLVGVKISKSNLDKTNINSNKQKNNIETKRPEGRQAVIDLFVSKDFDAAEGKKFHTYYKNRNWKTGNNQPVRNWKSLALNWIDRVELQGPGQEGSTVSSFKNHLKTPKIRDYANPL